MYLNYYGLKREPFQITPDPSFLFLSPGHKEALASIIYGVEKKKGFVLIVGPVGVGKTTILRAYLERVNNDKLKTIYVFNSNISYNNLLKLILRDLEVAPESGETSAMVTQLHEALIDEYRQGRNVLLLIDEAQNMPVDTLENLRMLSNFETTTEKLIQIVFSGQPEFEKTLNLQELKQLKQRIAVKAIILPFTVNEGVTYISHRLKAASGKDLAIFTSSALKKIVENAKGIPRVINVLCDNCLITAYGCGQKKVTVRLVKEILSDFGLSNRYHRRLIIFVTTLVVFIGIIALFELLTTASITNHETAEVIKFPQRSTPNRESTQTTTPFAQEEAYIHKIVERGDTLAKLIMDVYGHVNQKLIKVVKRANPNISDENLIIEGGRISFPIMRKNGRRE
jgi:general secretion pathway protein A